MRGSKGGVNYISGSLARAKAKSKPRSPHKPKHVPNNALFPPRVLILNTPSPTRKTPHPDQATFSPTRLSGADPVTPRPKHQRIEAKVSSPKLEESRYSRLAMGCSPTTQAKKNKASRQWWENVNKSNPQGRQYQIQLETRVQVLAEGGSKRRKTGTQRFDIADRLEGDDFLGLTRYTRFPAHEVERQTVDEVSVQDRG